MGVLFCLSYEMRHKCRVARRSEAAKDVSKARMMSPRFVRARDCIVANRNGWRDVFAATHGRSIQRSSSLAQRAANFYKCF